jgi:hypothetical protein
LGLAGSVHKHKPLKLGLKPFYDLKHMMSNLADMKLLKDVIMLMGDLESIASEAEYRPEDKARAVIAMLYSALKKGDRKIDPDIAAAVLRGSIN